MLASGNRRPLLRPALIVATLLALLAPATASADRTFAKRYEFGGTGDVVTIGNTLSTCTVALGNACSAARAGTASDTDNNNNAWNATNVDTDGVSGTENSSSATLTVPSGATVTFAGLYFGGRSAAATADLQRVSFRYGAGSYSTLTADGSNARTSAFDTSIPTTAPTSAVFYQGFIDVTSQVQANRGGAYWVGNVEGDAGSEDRYAGWSLVVAYSLPSAQRRQLYVYDGLQQVNSTAQRTITLNDLATPPTGTVDGRIGIVSGEGDRGITGDGLKVGGVTVSDGLNPTSPDNVFNSTIGTGGTRATDKNPDYVNQLGWDVDQIALPSAAIPAGSRSTTLDLSSTQDAYLPGVVTLASRAETDPPTTTLNTVPAATNNSRPTFTYSSNEAGSTFECSVDNATFSACPAAGYTPPAALNDGSHSFAVRAIDRVGNVDPNPKSATFTVDTVAPDTTITGGPAAGGFATTATPTFQYTSSQANSSFECQVDNGGWVACNGGAYTTGSLADGAHTFSVRAVDPAGNVDASPATRTFTVDTAAPDTTITSPTDGAFVNTTTPAIRFSSPDTGATFQCMVDNGAWTTCASGYSPTLTTGQHTIRVRAIDAAGNTDATPASVTITVDTAAPETSITGGPAAGAAVSNAKPTFQFESTETGSAFECKVDDGAYARCDGGSFTPATSLSEGAHTFSVRATDRAGNVDATPATRSFTVDTVAPDTTITGPSDGAVVATTRPTVTFTATQSGSTFQCAVDAGAYAACTSGYQPTLTQGNHTIKVRAIDPAGNVDATPASITISVDSVAPDTTITSGPTAGGSTNATTATLAFESTESPARFKCSLDGAAFTDCNGGSFTTPTLAEGSHTFRVYAIDAAGNDDSASPATRTWTVDTTAPTVTISSPAAGGVTNDDTPNVAFTASEAGATFECAVDGGSFATCSSPFTTAQLADGSHTVQVRATDAAGNRGPASSVTFRVDTAEPDTTITGPADGTQTNDTTPTITFSSSETNSTFECRIDTGAYVSCSSPFTTGTLAEGDHTVFVRATDAAGNTDSSRAAVTFTVDTTKPVVSITGGPAQGATSGNAKVTFTTVVDEAGTTRYCSIDDATAFTPCGGTFTTAALTDGAHTFRVYAVDRAGNTSATVERAFRVDATAPATAITAGPANGSAVATATPVFSFTADEASTFQCSVDGGAYATCSSPFTSPSLADGEHTFRVRAVDAVGNTDPSPEVRTFTVDTAAPNTTATGPTSPTNDPTPRITFSSNESAATFECSVNAGSSTANGFGACTSPFDTAPLADGTYTVRVRARDAAGNVDATPASVTFTVDTVAPTLAVTSGPAANARVNDDTPTFAFTAENGATVTCRIDGGNPSTCTSPYTTTSLTDGPHTVTFTATDAAGNTTTVSRTFTVDTAPPETTIDSGVADNGFTDDTTPDFAFSSETGATFECSVDGGAFAACTSPRTLPALAQGQHTFRVRAVDAAGNADPTPASRTFTVDTTAPDTTITNTAPAAGSVTRDAKPTFTFTGSEPGSRFECRIDGTDTDYKPCDDGTFTSATPLGQGSHTFSVRAIDRAGNVDASPATRTFTVDTVAPTLTITADQTAPRNATNDTTPTFAFTAESGSTVTCKVDNGEARPCTTPFTTPQLAEGTHTVVFVATDAAGNTTTVTRTFVVDITKPTSRVTGPADNSFVTTATPAITFEASDPGSTFECAVDDGPFVACESGFTTPTLTEGTHRVRVRATDPAGNVQETAVTVNFKVDTQAPETTGTGPSGLITTSTPGLSFASPDTTATFQCRVDGGEWRACASPYTADRLRDGDHTIEVRAVDPAGNVDPTPLAVAFTIDTGPPDTSIDGAGGTVAPGAQQVAFGSDEDGVTYECSVDGGAFTPCDPRFATPSFTSGTHTLAVRARDRQGGVDPTPATITWTVASPAAPAPAPAPAATPSPSPAATPAPATPAEEEDLGTLPGSLVSATKCQKLGGAGFVRTRKPGGIGKVLIKLRSNATSPPGTPLRLTMNSGRRATVTWTLDGRRIRGSSRGVTIAPSLLAGRRRHTLRPTFTARNGKKTTYRLSFKTLRCNAVMTASQSSLKTGSVLRLRIDALRAITVADFTVPATTLRRYQRIRLRYRSAGADRTRSFVYRRAGNRLARPAGAPPLRLSGGRIVVSGLPDATGIVRVDVSTRSKPIGRGREASLRSRVTAGGRRLPLKTKTRAPARQ